MLVARSEMDRKLVDNGGRSKQKNRAATQKVNRDLKRGLKEGRNL